MDGYGETASSERFGFFLGPLRRDKSPDNLASLLLKLLNSLGIRCTDIQKISINSRISYARISVKSPACEDYALGMLSEPGQIMNIFDLRRITHRPYHLVVERLEPTCYIRLNPLPRVPCHTEPCNINVGPESCCIEITTDHTPDSDRTVTPSDETGSYGSDLTLAQSPLNSYSANKIGIRVLPHSNDSTYRVNDFQNTCPFSKSPKSPMLIRHLHPTSPELINQSEHQTSCSSSLDGISKSTYGDSIGSESGATYSSHVQFKPLEEQKGLLQELRDKIHGRDNWSDSTTTESRDISQFTPLEENGHDTDSKQEEAGTSSGGVSRLKYDDADLNYNQSRDETNHLDTLDSLPSDDEDHGMDNLPNSSYMDRDEVQCTCFFDDNDVSAEMTEKRDALRPGTSSRTTSTDVNKTDATTSTEVNKVDVKTSTAALTGLCFCIGRVFYHKHEQVIGLNPLESETEHNELFRGEILNKPKQFRDRVGPAICALLNSAGGVLFFGVSKDGKAQGVLVDQKLEDSVRLDIDMLVKRVRPAVPPSAYTINFPGIMGDDGRLIQDLKILEIRVKAGDKIKDRFFFKNVVYIIRNGAIEERETRCSRSSIDQERC